jgi:CheY-like chemotaxis protein
MPEIYLQDLLTAQEDRDVGDSYAITRFPHVIGRDPDCDTRFPLPWISRRHCKLFVVDDRVWLEDLGSRNGTSLNGKRLESPQPLHEGDQLDLAGLAFEVHLSRAPAAPTGTAAGNADKRPSAQPGRNVLVVEDNADAAETMAILLREWGYDVAVAHDGVEALSLAQENHPETVLLDIRLPGIDGYEVAKRLRTEAGLQEARLVAMTGYQDEADAERVEKAGLHTLLTKPVAPDALHEAIADVR